MLSQANMLQDLQIRAAAKWTEPISDKPNILLPVITNSDQHHVNFVRILIVRLRLATSKLTASLMEGERLGNTLKTFVAREISISHLK